MRDDPRSNLKWLEQELLAEDSLHRDFSKLPDPQYHRADDLMERIDRLLDEDPFPEEAEPEILVRNFANRYGKESKGQRAERLQAQSHPEEDACVPVKTKQQLRREEKLQKQADRKAGINRSIKGLVFLAILEILGILAIIGWWLQ